ncbi:MAG: hypothetical protein WBC44_05330 [Planctomycetaceae bacterium]
MSESREPEEATPPRRSEWPKCFTWGLLGGFGGLVVFFTGILILGASNGLFSGERGSEFVAYGMSQLFLYGAVPAIVFGAVVGAVAARWSLQITIAAAVGVAGLMLAIGWTAFAVYENRKLKEHEEVYGDIVPGPFPSPAEADNAWVFRISQGLDALEFSNCSPLAGVDAPIDCDRRIVSKRPGEAGVVFTGNDTGPSWATVTLSWPEPDLFEAVFDFEAQATAATRIEAADNLPGLDATFNGAPWVVPTVVHPADQPQQLIVRGRVSQ